MTLSVFTKYLCISEHKRLVNTIRSHLRPIYLGSWSEKFWSTELEACYDCFWPSQSNTHTAARHRLHAYPRMVRHINDMQSFAFVTINLTIWWNFSSWKCMLDVADEVSKHKFDKDCCVLRQAFKWSFSSLSTNHHAFHLCWCRLEFWNLYASN